MKYFVEPSLTFTPSKLYEYVEDFKSSQEYKRLVNLERYYRAENTTIMNRKKTLNDDINNKLVSGFPRYISTMCTGYFTGGNESIKYVFPKKNKEIDNNFNYNDEKSVTTNLSKNASIFGYAIEQYFIDKNGKFRFKEIDPKNVILLFEDNIDEDLLSVIKFREYPYKKNNGDEAIKLVLEFYTKENYQEYTYIDGSIKDELTIEEANIFNDVPFTYYENPDRMGDFESVIALIDAYDKALSDNSNLFEYYNDCYIVFEGCDVDENIKLKEMKGLNIPTGASVSYLKKPEVTGDLINYLDTLRKDIHKFSGCPDITASEYLNAASGTSLLLKLQGLEFLTGVKEANFRKGLTRRLEILAGYLSLANNEFDFSQALIIFKRNTISSLSEIIDEAVKLNGIISKQSLLELLPNVDAEEELKRLEKEKEDNQLEFNMQNNINDFFSRDNNKQDDTKSKIIDQKNKL